MNLAELLHTTFGFPAFRANQEAVCHAVKGWFSVPAPCSANERPLRPIRLLPITIISLGLTACGTSNVSAVPVSPVAPSPPQMPPTSLTGNWFLAGARVPAVYPVLSTTLYIDGNTVTGQAAFDSQCTSANGQLGIGAGGSVAINGTIANDGTFQAATGTPGNPTTGTISLSISGNSPLPATPSIWTGTYALLLTPGPTPAPCDLGKTATFTATPIAPLTGTYIGLPATSAVQSPFGPGAIVSVQIMQGTPTLVLRRGTNRYLIPLTANLTIANSPCPISGLTTAAPIAASTIDGDSFQLFFNEQVPLEVLSGTLNDPTANTFSADLTTLARANGCPGVAFYNFTRK